MKPGSDSGTCTGNVPGVLRYFRLNKHNMIGQNNSPRINTHVFLPRYNITTLAHIKLCNIKLLFAIIDRYYSHCYNVFNLESDGTVDVTED